MHLGIVLILLLLLSMAGVFASTETAFLSLDKKRRAQYIGKKNPMSFLNSLLLSNSIAVTLFSEIMNESVKTQFETFLSQCSQGCTSIVSVLMSTGIIVIFGESIPKNVGIVFPTVILRLFFWIVNFNYKILYPIIHPITKGMDLFFKGVKERNTVRQVSPEDIKTLVGLFSKKAILTSTEKKLINSLLSLYNMKVSSYMIPRREVLSVDLGDSLQNVWDKVVKNNLSRILVRDKSIDNVLGFLGVADLSYLVANYPEQEVFKHQSKIKPIVSLSENKRIIEAIFTLSRQKISIAVVIDEYGGVEGLVTMNLLLQGLFSLKDESRVSLQGSSNEIVLQAQEDFIIVDAIKMSLRSAKSFYNIDSLEKTDEQSVSSVILKKLDRFPYEGEVLFIDGLELTVVKMYKKSIQEVKIKKPIEEEKV